MKSLKESLINEGKNCGVCSFDEGTNAEFHGENYLVSYHCIAGPMYNALDPKAGIGLYFAKNTENNDLKIVSLNKKDKILFMWDLEPMDQGHSVDSFYCPACGKKLI